MSKQIPNLLTFDKFAEKHEGAFTVQSLRWMRFHDKTNGFEGAFLKVGGRVLIDEEKFFAAIDQVAARH